MPPPARQRTYSFPDRPSRMAAAGVQVITADEVAATLGAPRTSGMVAAHATAAKQAASVGAMLTALADVTNTAGQQQQQRQQTLLTPASSTPGKQRPPPLAAGSAASTHSHTPVGALQEDGWAGASSSAGSLRSPVFESPSDEEDCGGGGGGKSIRNTMSRTPLPRDSPEEVESKKPARSRSAVLGSPHGPTAQRRPGGKGTANAERAARPPRCPAVAAKGERSFPRRA